jgi:glycolate oxidase FAD binding subunit
MPNLSSAPFADIVGMDHVTEREGRPDSYPSRFTIAPANAEQTAAIMKLCSQLKLAVNVCGGLTKVGWGNPPTSTDVRVHIDMRRLAGVHEHSWGDLTATVGAGTRWVDMQRTLAQHNQRIALDPLFVDRITIDGTDNSTVGGIVATNDSGALRLRYGSLRDLVIGMTIVLADGTIARSGGKVVKNVAGYDLPKLLIGSFGTLGIITEVTFRLHPLPQTTADFTVRSSAIAPLADLMSAVLKSSLSVEAMQLRNEPQLFALDVRLASLPGVLVDQEASLRSLAAAFAFETAAAETWQHRERLFGDSNTRFHDDAATVLKITCLPQKLSALVDGFAQLDQEPFHTARCVADPVGIVTAAITAPPDALAEIIDDLRARLLSTGGTVVVLQDGQLPYAFDGWGPRPAAIDIMRAVKQQFDPQRLLNPGCFVGGI